MPFDPESISGLRVWLDASQITGLADTDPVSSWPNLIAAESESFTQSTSTAQPTYRTGLLNGLPGVEFDGTGDHLDGSVSRTLKPVTMFVVARPDVVASPRTLLGNVAGDGATQWRINGVQNILKEKIVVVGSSATSLTATDPVVLDASYSSTGASLFGLDGADDGTGANDQTILSAAVCVGARDSSIELFSGAMFEILVYDTVLSSTDRQDVRDYLIDKWFTAPSTSGGGEASVQIGVTATGGGGGVGTIAGGGEAGVELNVTATAGGIAVGASGGAVTVQIGVTATGGGEAVTGIQTGGAETGVQISVATTAGGALVALVGGAETTVQVEVTTTGDGVAVLASGATAAVQINVTATGAGGAVGTQTGGGEATVTIQVGATGAGTGSGAQSQPTMVIDIAFGSVMTDDTPVWTDVSPYLRAAQISVGRPSVDQRFDTGTASLLLDNRDGRFTPDNPASPYYPDVRLGVPVRVAATWQGVIYPLFVGSVRAWPVQYPTGNIESVVEVPLADGFYTLNQMDLGGQSFPAQPSDERLHAVLDAAGWPAGLRDIDDGIATVQAVDVAQPADGGEQPVLAHLLDVAESEVGVLFMSPDGKVTFRNRVAMSAVTPAVTFTGVDYQTIGLTFDDSVLFNDLQVARENGGQIHYVNAASAAAHGRRVLTRDVMPMGNDPEAFNVAEWLSALFGEQRLRISELGFTPRKTAALMTWMLTLGLRDVVTVAASPPGVTPISQLSVIEQVRHEIRPMDWATVWTVVPITDLEQHVFWTLGTSELGSGTRLA